MASIFSRRRRQPDDQDPENRPDQRHDLLRAFVPASARPHEMQRLHALNALDANDDETDGPDEDLEFLASLVEEIERQPTQEPARFRPAPIETVKFATDEEKFNVFSAMRVEPERVRTSQDLGVRDVDMDDLLEDLSTTAAAIRRRKAA